MKSRTSTAGSNDEQDQLNGTSCEAFYKLIKELVEKRQHQLTASETDKTMKLSHNLENGLPRETFQRGLAGMLFVGIILAVGLSLKAAQKDERTTHPVQPVDNDGPHHGAPPVSMA
ncbi:hypothetical protein Bbelb_078310 [Branchiostoma belcheri]|nr:hypothetical protein Bbelb_078310 [Branchiostoma belcheri]